VKNVSVYRNPVSRIYASSNYPGTVSYGGHTAPDRTVVKLAYAQFNQLTSVANLFANQIYRGNYIFDRRFHGFGN